MSSYLNTLTARQLGVAEIIRPRLSTRFEPPRSADAAITGAFAPTEQPQEMSLAADTEFDSPPLRQVGFSSVKPPPELLQPKLVVSAGTGDFPLSLDGRGQRRGCLSVPDPWNDYKRPLSLALSHEGREDKKVANLPSMKERTLSRQQESLGGPSSVESIAPPDEQRQALTRRHAEAVMPSSVRPVIPTTIVVQPRVTRYSEPQAPPLAESPAALQPTPTIQVTIGRIEVRATPPPARAYRPRPTQPVMSLDEYLRQRHGGQR